MKAGWQTGLILGALCLSLVLNFIAYQRIGDLQSDIQSLESLRTEIRMLSDDVRMTTDRVEEVKEEQRWVTDQSWSITEENEEIDCEGEVPIATTWAFRKALNNANVFIEYREIETVDWQRVDAEPTESAGYRATFDLDAGTDWEYRMTSETDQETRTSSPERLFEIAELTQRHLLFENGESRSQDGNQWFRYIIDMFNRQTSICNEIVAATIEIYDGDDVVESVEMEPEHPGDHDPEGYDSSGSDGAASRSQSDQGSGWATTEDGAEAEEARPQVWWSDWIVIEEDYEPVAVVEFADGTTETLDRMGPN